MKPPAPPSPVQGLKLAIIEDDRRFRDQILDWCARTPSVTCVGAFANGEAALRDLPDRQPDVILVDLNLPGISGVETIRRLRARFPALRAVVLTVFEDVDHIFQALEAGACGYLTKTAQDADLLQAVTEAGQGGGTLSPEVAIRIIEHFNQRGRRPTAHAVLAPREQEVLQCLARGLSYKEIAHELHLSPHTVNDHLKSIYSKLHVHSRAAAVAKVFGR